MSVEGLDPVFAAKVNALLAAAGGKVTIKSGHRSKERQTQLWNAALKKYGSVAAARKWVAPPGRSNHEKGAAVDFGGDLRLVAQLAARFGLTQPLSNEPWHYEQVGQRSKAPAGSVRAAERRTADAGHDTPGHAHNEPVAAAATAVLPPDPMERERFTVEYQLQSLGNILLGSGTSDG